MISWFTTMVLRERSSLKLRQIKSLLFGTRQTLRQAVVNQTCRILDRRVRTTKNTWCYDWQCAIVRGSISMAWFVHVSFKRALRHFRPHLTREVANTVACSIVVTQIDYCNSLFYGAPEKYLDRLERLQNRLTRIVMNADLRGYHSVDIPSELHWLPIWGRIISKVELLCRRALNDDQPTGIETHFISTDQITALTRPETAPRI